MIIASTDREKDLDWLVFRFHSHTHQTVSRAWVLSVPWQQYDLYKNIVRTILECGNVVWGQQHSLEKSSKEPLAD